MILVYTVILFILIALFLGRDLLRLAQLPYRRSNLLQKQGSN